MTEATTNMTTSPHDNFHVPIDARPPAPPPDSAASPVPVGGGGGQGGAGCSGLRRRLSPDMLAVTGACKVLGAAFSTVGLVMALRILVPGGQLTGPDHEHCLLPLR